MEFYEYLFTAILIFSILIASSIMIVPMVQPSRNVTEKEQIKIVTQKIMTQLVLNTGDPPDWGSDTSIRSDDLTAFGLAKYADTTRDAYVLDADKVNRLISNNPSIQINPSTAAKLLNLDADYGFAIEFYPALDVHISTESNKYSITVKSPQTGSPIVNAKITAKMFSVTDGNIVGSDQKEDSTATNGKCTIEFDDTNTEMKVLAVAISYNGLNMVTFKAAENVKQAKIIGNRLYVNEHYDISSAIEIITVKSSAGYSIQNLPRPFNLISINEKTYELEYVEPSTVAVLATDGNTLIFASKEIPKLTYSTIQDADSLPLAYTLERMVTIADSAYYLRLQVWRMSW